MLDPAEAADAPFWEQDTLSHTIVTDKGPIGRGVFKERMRYIRYATTATALYHYNKATEEWHRDAEPVPFAGKPVYVFAAHALPGVTEVPTEANPGHRTRGERTGGMLKRRPSLARLPQDHAVLMEACSSGAAPGLARRRRGVDDTFVPDPLGAVSESQHVANETGRVVYGGTREVGLGVRDGAPVHFIHTDSRGRRGSGWSTGRNPPGRCWTSAPARRDCTPARWARPPRRPVSGHCGWYARCGRRSGWPSRTTATTANSSRALARWRPCGTPIRCCAAQARSALTCSSARPANSGRRNTVSWTTN
ncbi:hypothetical protein SHKM778_18740 [Streptomyces sp. KM77-8]|uniref:Uncharacterized protein n=1 Tax=Streptomyces haneummycinicus TaxID=3074435 RepID=A0AAT9HDV5_9ACTN